MSTLEAPLLAVKDGMVTFGGNPLFSRITFGIHPRDRICLLGRNGAGKTTLMKVITGERELDGGERTFQPGIKIGYLPQQPEEYTQGNVRDYVLSGLPKEERGEEHSYRADMVLGPLGLDADRQLAGLSGGQMRRAALARALVSQPEILLLDEPTNHLDLPTIFWLEEYLSRYPGALLLISHDRRFLANVTGKVFWMDRGTMRVLGKGYAEFDHWAEGILASEEAELRRLGKKLEEEEVWRQQGVTARRTRNMRRMGELHRLREKLRQEKAHRRRVESKIILEESETVFYSKMVAEFRNVSLSFVTPAKAGAQGSLGNAVETLGPGLRRGDEEKRVDIISHFSTKIQRGDRIGILGPNGSGKTTLVELLTGNLQPTGGNIRRAVNLNISYFDQRRRQLNPKKTLWETLCPQGGDRVQVGAKSRHVVGYLKDFLFDPKQAQSPTGSLSGGEANRLLLAKVLAQPGDVLVLDEPTNDLDMDSLDVLEDFLGEYSGTLVLVSHDRDFLDRTVTRLLAFEEGGHIEEVIGGYSDYERQKAASSAPRKAPSSTPAQEKERAASVPSRASAPVRMSYKDKRELEMLPEKIATLEARISQYNELLADPGLYMRDPATFDESSRGLEKARAEKDRAETRWLELEAMREAAEG